MSQEIHTVRRDNVESINLNLYNKSKFTFQLN